MLAKADYPALAKFLDDSYHQDWDAVSATMPGVVEHDFALLTPEERQEVKGDLERLFAVSATDADYEHYLDATGANVVPAAQGFTARTLLLAVKDVLNRS